MSIKVQYIQDFSFLYVFILDQDFPIYYESTQCVLLLTRTF